MKNYFNLDLENKDDAQVRADGGKLVVKCSESSYYDMMDTAPLTNAIAALKTADDNKGKGTESTATAVQKRAVVDYQFTALVGLINAKIADPTVPDVVKVLMIDATGLPKAGFTPRGKDKFGYYQETPTTPKYLHAPGIPGGSGVHQWMTSEDQVSFSDPYLYDPTETATCELTEALPNKDMAAKHRFLKKGIWSTWEGPIYFRTK